MSKFAKRHYEVIAQALQDAHPSHRDISHDEGATFQWGFTRREIANAFARDNGAFDRARFIRACEPGANVRARG